MLPSKTDEEKQERYDRQVRLWGSATQQRLGEARIEIHSCTGVACEVAKTVVLAGVKEVSIVDDSLVGARDVTAASFLFHAGDVGAKKGPLAQKRLQELNPYVDAKYKTGDSSLLMDDPAPSARVVVLMCGLPLSMVREIIQKHKGARPCAMLLFVVVYHYCGAAFAWFLHGPSAEASLDSIFGGTTIHSDAARLPRAALRTIFAVRALQQSGWCPEALRERPDVFGTTLERLFALRAASGLEENFSDEDLQVAMDMAGGGGCARCVDCSIIGGLVGQEIISEIGKDSPTTSSTTTDSVVRNWMVFDDSASGAMECIVGK